MIFRKLPLSEIEQWLKAIERIAITLAALAAILPMWQYYTEAGDRRLDRMTRVVQAHQACLDFGTSTIPDLLNSNVSAMEGFLEPEVADLGRVARMVLLACDEIEKETLPQFTEIGPE